MKTDVQLIERHLNNKGKYRKSYISRVCSYMEKNSDLAEEFRRSLPKDVLLDKHIEIRGTSAKELGATTLLSRSAIYIVLARLREEPSVSKKKIINEELDALERGTYKH